MARIMVTNTAGRLARAGGCALGAAVLALTAAGPAWADVKAGVDAWSAGDFSRAVVEWQGPAAKGDPDALFNLAQAYRLGRGVEVDNARARKLYEEAARLGHVKAADNYGLMLFQEGEQQRAMPMVRAASDRGDPRAQYVLGLSHFNADYAERDWVRAYALMTLANGSGLPQARDALVQMDQYVPQGQRAQAQSLARELEAKAKAQLSTEIAAAELTAPVGTPVPASSPAVTIAAASPAPASARAMSAAPVATAMAKPARAAPVARTGRWRVQLGAFGVASNADKLWGQLGRHSVLAGTAKTLVSSGKLTRLLASGFASQAEAQRACTSLKQDGKACVVAGQG